MNVPIRVVPVVDNRKQTIPRKFALVVDHAEDVGIEDIGDGKRAAIYFERSSIEPSPEDENVHQFQALHWKSDDQHMRFVCRFDVCPRTLALCFSRLIRLLSPHGA